MMWNYFAAIAAWLMLACIATAADPFKPAGKGDPFKVVVKDQCKCGGEPALCICSACDCAGGSSCRVAKKVVLPKAPPVAYKHDCGCPSLGCNCAPLGGCHCSENRQSNRVNPEWIKYIDGWGLFRGATQIGWLGLNGMYNPVHNGEICEPCKAPIPLPNQRSEARVVASASVCRS